jgi:putative nucleotidyltransferase with HDIG domain
VRREILRLAEECTVIDQMDKAMLALQSAAVGRRLYGLDHPLPTRQTDVAADTLRKAAIASTRELRLVRLEDSLLFEDADLPSCGVFREVLIPRLIAHGVEWLEFRPGLTRAELVTLMDQLERAPADAGRLGTPNVRVGHIGRDNADNDSNEADTHLGSDGQVAQLKQMWGGLQGSDRPDQRLGDLVESIRLAVAVGADVCNRLAEVKSHDEYTFVHTVNVGILSAALGEAVGMNQGQVFDLILAALLHDVGKQRTPLTILNKPGQLDDSERRQMELHPVTGAAMLFERQGVPDVAPIVAFEHHANVDGTGYPRLPRTGRPHIASQIVHVADVFDALRTNRPYRAAMDDAKVRQILLDGAGKLFDPALVDLFLQHVITRAPARSASTARRKSA